MTQLSLMIDPERCFGCKSCEAACKAEHGLGPGEYRNRVLWLADPAQDNLSFLTLSCQHCTRPACVRACPVTPKAIEKDPETGVVKVIEDLCTGCGECVIACPYGAMGYDAQDHHAVKCDLCANRREVGKKPACATVCPGEAIKFGERDDHVAWMADNDREAQDHDAFLLAPSNIYLKPLSEDRNPTLSTVIEEGIGHLMPAIVDDKTAAKILDHTDPDGPYRKTDYADRIPDATYSGGCNICFNACSVDYHIKDGKVIRVTGNEKDPQWKGKICPKSQFLLQLYNSDHRLKTPLKRVGPRGAGKFIPISWDQALDEIAEKLKIIAHDYGPEALAVFAGTRTGTLTRKGFITLFIQMWGTQNFGDTETFCSESKDLAFVLTQGESGSGNSYTEQDIGSAGLYVYFGDNQAETRPVHFGMVNNWRHQNKAKMIVVDPRQSVTASKADQWLPIRSGTDMALALALCYHILEKGLEDRTFCENWIVGFDLWRDHILGRAFSPKWASPITGLEAHEIERLAEDIAKADGCILFGGRGLNQHSNATQTNRIFMFLAAITGNWGRKGGAYFNFGTQSVIEVNAPENRKAQNVPPPIGKNPLDWIDAILDNRPHPLRALITSNNPLTAWPDQNRVREAFQNLDLLVHIDLFENETSSMADYVLPAATGVEKGEIGRANEDRRIVWIDKVIDGPGEAKSDDWIWIELGKRFGFEDVLKEEYKDTALFWDEMCIDTPAMRGCTQKRLHSTPWQWVRTPVISETAEEIETLYLEGTTALGAPDGHRFPTASGKLEFWTDAMDARFALHGLSALPEFYADQEHLIPLPRLDANGKITKTDQPLPSGHELMLVTGRPPAAHFHSWTHYAWQAQEMWADLYIQIHPDTAKSRKIEDGETVTIQTDHGKAQARAWVYGGIRKDTVFIPIGWDDKQPYNPWPSLNFLTNSDQRDPISHHSNLKSYRCSVFKR